jgi:hypothetical protein
VDTAVETPKKASRKIVKRDYLVSARESVNITAETVKLAAKHAAAATPADTIKIRDWFDERHPYLHLRQRGRSVTWFFRLNNKSAKIGVALNERGGVGYLSIAAARETAVKAYVLNHPGSATAAAAPEPASWTWSELDASYQASLTDVRVTKSNRIKHPSVGTQDDVRQSLGKPEIAIWGPLSINKLTVKHVIGAINAIHKKSGHRACSKALTYVKSTLNHAMKLRFESGITHEFPWWTTIVPPDPTGPAITNMLARKKVLVQAKTDYSVKHLAELLVAHEEFCAGRTGNEQISPGVRWGIWWVAFTANRRRTPTILRRTELLFEDEFGRPGWGVAMWGDDEMKGQSEFWLPLPPAVLHIGASSIADWEAIVNKSASPARQSTAWVFSSTRRVGRNPNNVDVAVNASSLSHYLEDLRAWAKFPKQTTKLKGGTVVPMKFTLHLARSVVGNWLDNHPEMPRAASSLVLAHAAKKQGGSDEVSAVTERYYLTGQKMDVKAVAMEAWSDAVLAAYKMAGGKPPMPRKA